MMEIQVIILFLYIVVGGVLANDCPIVDTVIGAIRGVRSDDGQYNMYMGIPYAKVNETNPFGESIPHPKFEEIFEANDDSSMCPQIDKLNSIIAGDLDCLRLNIYTPTNVNSNSRLPVLVWIFGGKFDTGSYRRFTYGPTFLVRDDIILVMMNYRIGVYGFMCLDIPEVPGNQSMKDQISALRWIKSHISAFGGDPEHVTIGGSSSGAMSVDFHLHRDNAEEKLFDKVIVQSGSTFSVSLKMPVRDAPIVLAKYFEFETDDVYAALKFLAGLPPLDVVAAEKTLGLSINEVCLEKSFDGVKNYLTDNWILKKHIPAVDSIKVLIGYNDDEMGFVRNNPPVTKKIDKLAIWFNTHHEDFDGMSELVDQFYIGDGAETFDSVLNMSSDLVFVHPVYKAVYKYIENNAGDIYFYKFSYVGDRNYFKRKFGIVSSGACHADELGYIFDMKQMPEKPTADDQLMIDKMSKMWTNFVKYGNPTPELTQLIDTKWSPVRHNSPMYIMNIDKQLTMDTGSLAGRITFWDVFYEKNGHLQWALLRNY